MELTLQQAAKELRESVRDATRNIVDRDLIVDLILLSAVAGEHLLIIGPPGTAKSAVVRSVSNAIGGNYFEYLLGRFTEPSELFGSVDIRKLSDGIVETAVEGMLPEAEVAFLDEVFLGSTAILNTLLGILNERKFKRGHTNLRCPLRICVAASNHLPEDEALAAFADRFLVHSFIERVDDASLEDLLRTGWNYTAAHENNINLMQHLDFLSDHLKKTDLSQILPHLSRCIRLLRKEGIDLSDRRIVKSQSLIAAAACLAGRETATQADLWPLLYVIPTQQNQQSARDILRDELEQSANENLPSATENASLGPLARAQRLVDRANLLLAEPLNDEMRLKLEAVGREIDAGFVVGAMPAPLVEVREKLLSILSEVPDV